MPPPKDAVRLRHMLDHAREAVDLMQGRSRADLDADRLLGLGLVRLLEIIGEAAGRVSLATQHRYADIPWSQIISLRNRLIHGYDSVDMDVLYQILLTDIPLLIVHLNKIVPARDEPRGL